MGLNTIPFEHLLELERWFLCTFSLHSPTSHFQLPLSSFFLLSSSPLSTSFSRVLSSSWPERLRSHSAMTSLSQLGACGPLCIWLMEWVFNGYNNHTGFAMSFGNKTFHLGLWLGLLAQNFFFKTSVSTAPLCLPLVQTSCPQLD